MKRFANIQNESGLTLLELLLALTISTIVLGMISGVFIMGLKVYKVTGIEGQLRDEADYIVSMVLNELYETAPDYIQYCEESGSSIKENCIQLVNGENIKVENKSGGRFSVEAEEEKVEAEILIEDKKVKVNYLNDDGSTATTKTLSSDHISITEQPIPTTSDTSSILEITCTSNPLAFDPTGIKKCSSGFIDIKFQIENTKYSSSGNMINVDPLGLNSSFGF